MYACYCEKYKETYEDVIDGDETTVELRQTQSQNWVKPGNELLRAAGGKIGKPKHSPKLHLFGAISRKGLTPLVIFKGTMYSKDYQNILSLSILPFIQKKYPYGHRFFMDNDPKHTSHSTRSFIWLNEINHCETPPQSPVN